jgi:hypothetical protein
MISLVLKGVISAVLIVLVSEIARLYPRIGALLLTLPLVSILAFIMTWTRDRNLATISTLARETLVLVPLGLPFFLPLAFAGRMGMGFWSAMAAGAVFASLTIGAWFWLGPKTL